MINEIRIFSPATVSNVACGFDVLGFALESIGDEMIVRKTTQKGLTINNVSGFDLPMDIKKNIATNKTTVIRIPLTTRFRAIRLLLLLGCNLSCIINK